MLKNFWKRPEKITLGISVDATNFNYVVVKKNHRDFSLLEQGAFEAATTAKALELIKKNFDFPCYLVLSHRFISVKNIQLTDSFKENEIRQLLKLNANQYFAAPLEEICFDFEFLCRIRQKVRIIASKKSHIVEWQSLFAEAKLTLQAITIDIVAIEQFLLYYKLVSTEKIYGVFFCSGDEFLQMVVVDSFVCFVSSAVIAHRTTEFFCQEIIKFFRLYELNQFHVAPIAQLICLDFEEQAIAEIEKHIALPLVRCDSSFCLNANVLSLGAVLSC